MQSYQFIERTSPFCPQDARTLPILLLHPQTLIRVQWRQQRDWARKAGFKAASGTLLPFPGVDGKLGGALFGLGAKPQDTPFIAGKLVRLLPPGDWHIETTPLTPTQMALGFGLGAYSFDRYKSDSPALPRLRVPAGVDSDHIHRELAAIYLVRDLINTPANDMGPVKLEATFRELASHYKAVVKVSVGDALLDHNFPLVHAVGRAGAEAPRLMEMRWGKPGAPKLTLVGKGVCFDTGGLDIEPASGMALMKKDMGGAANVLGLAMMIMDAGLKVDLRVIVPAVENSISANAFRPGDIYRSRKGLSVQIDNTDAEGRLILADALTLADEEAPDLLIDMATLTGAARTALGPDVPPFFTDDEDLAAGIAASSIRSDDPFWRLPLHRGYEKDLSAKIADLTNAPSGGMAGAITAALFLNRFVSDAKSWVHFDVYGWAPAERPHGPSGGEAQAIRALYHHIVKRFV